jgi:hypothetical protein
MNENVKLVLNKIDKKTHIKKKLIEEQKKLKLHNNKILTEFKILNSNINKGENELEQLVYLLFTRF